MFPLIFIISSCYLGYILQCSRILLNQILPIAISLIAFITSIIFLLLYEKYITIAMHLLIGLLLLPIFWRLYLTEIKEYGVTLADRKRCIMSKESNIPFINSLERKTFFFGLKLEAYISDNFLYVVQPKLKNNIKRLLGYILGWPIIIIFIIFDFLFED